MTPTPAAEATTTRARPAAPRSNRRRRAKSSLRATTTSMAGGLAGGRSTRAFIDRRSSVIGLLLPQPLGESLPGGGQRRSDRAARDAHGGGHLVLWKIHQVSQDDSHALALGELAHDRPDLAVDDIVVQRARPRLDASSSSC